MGRARAAALIVRDGKLLLIRRRRAGREYYVLPGGGLEQGETYEAACRREVLEETGLQVISARLVLLYDNMGNPESSFLVTTVPSEPVLGGEEALQNSPENAYQLTWVSPEDLMKINVVPRVIRELSKNIPWNSA
ncbi:MAG: NUDIX domain-containing protein [Anaerolineae bacterium]|nr:NUDIX domain-containing protein [Anaerolineae bacterium]